MSRKFIFSRPAAKAPIRAVLVCPDGGYHHLVWSQEGLDIAAFLKLNGFTAFVLKYFCPDRMPYPMTDRDENSLGWYIALNRAGVPFEIHLFADGGHGYGLMSTGNAVSEWGIMAGKWLRRQTCR